VLAKTARADLDSGIEARFRDGDELAFGEIVRTHREALYRMARRLLATHEDADEAAQVAFVRAWRARAQFRGEASLRTWLIRIVMNVARSMRHRPGVEQGLEGAEAMPDTQPGADERVIRDRLRKRVRRAVDTLPARQREVVLLKVFAELTHREVARLMGLSEGAVKAHLHQAVANLRRRMAEPVTEGEC